MNIHYRIIKVDPSSHGIQVRYFTDVVTEMDLANSLNPDGSVILNADGYPISTRTDVMISVYDTPSPSNEELEKLIMLNAPVTWLKLKEDIKNPDINTKMSKARDLTGESKSMTLDELDILRKNISESNREERTAEKAYGTIIDLLDCLKVVATEDPHVLKGLYEVLQDIKKIAES